MFYKKLDSGKYRYYEKYYDDAEGKWKQVSITMTSKSRVIQAEAKRLLSIKIEEKLNRFSLTFQDVTVNDIKEDFLKIRKLEVKESTYTQQKHILEQFFSKFGKLRIDKVTTNHLQAYFLTIVLKQVIWIRIQYLKLFCLEIGKM